MVKTLKDFILKGGIKGRKFLDTKNKNTTYIVKGVSLKYSSNKECDIDKIDVEVLSSDDESLIGKNKSYSISSHFYNLWVKN